MEGWMSGRVWISKIASFDGSRVRILRGSPKSRKVPAMSDFQGLSVENVWWKWMKMDISGQKHTWKNITSAGYGGVYHFNIAAFCKVCSWIISWQPCVLQGVGGVFRFLVVVFLESVEHAFLKNHKSAFCLFDIRHFYIPKWFMGLRYTYIYIYICIPGTQMTPVFIAKGLLFGGLNPQNRGQTGSRYS